MLTADQIDYLLQIRKTKDRIPNDTVRVMLSALRWSEEDIERGISFINKQFSQAESSTHDEPRIFKPTEVRPKISEAVNIKQNPFPVGSPFHTAVKQKENSIANRHRFFGYVAGAVLFLSGVVIYVKFFN